MGLQRRSDRERRRGPQVTHLRRPPQAARIARASAVKFLLAALLSLSVSAAAVPFEVFSAADGCQMSCCQGEGGEAGGRAGESCHALVPEESAHAAHAAHASPARPHAHADGHGTEHSAGDGVTQRDIPHPSASHPRVSKPCPPDCGAALASFTQLRRHDDAAALTRKARTRTRTASVSPRAPDGATKTSPGLRRLCPPRAPPSAHAALPA